MVGQEALWRNLVAMLGALLGDCGKTVADLHALHRIDAHQRGSQFAVELAVDRLTPARRHAFGHHVDPRTYRIAGLAQGIHVTFQHRHLFRRRPEERVVFHHVPVERLRGDFTQL